MLTLSLRTYLFSLLVALPFYTYSLNLNNAGPNRAQPKAEEKRSYHDVRRDLEARQNIETDPTVLASLSSVLKSLSDVVASYTQSPDPNIDLSSFAASISSVYVSVSSEIFNPTDNVPSTTSAGATSSRASGASSSSSPAVTSSASFSTGTPGEVVTDGGRTGTVGIDGTTRFCSASSYLCPASVNYGCCASGYRCGLTACTPTSTGVVTATESSQCSSGAYLCPSSLGFGCCPTGYSCGLTNCLPTTAGATSSPAGKQTTDYYFEPASGTNSKGDAPATSGAIVSNKKSGLSGGAIGGIVGGVVGGIALIAAGVIWFCIAKKKNKKTPLAPNATGPAPAPVNQEQYTGGPLPPQPQMAQYNQYGSPTSPNSAAPQYQAYHPQQGGYQQGGYPQGQGYGQPPQGYYGQGASELAGGTAVPSGQKGPEPVGQPPANVYEAPVNQPAYHQQQQYGQKPSGPVYEVE